MSPTKSGLYIKTISRARSISAAAEELGISQPALSSYLKKCEEQLGTPIFDRSRSPLELTEAGQAYVEYLNGIESLGRKLNARISDIEELRTGKLVVGGAGSFNAAYLPEAIREFQDKHPNVEIEVVDDTASNLAILALEGSIDLFVTPMPDRTSDYHCEELLTERIFICVPSSFSLPEGLAASADGTYFEVGADVFESFSECTFIMLKPHLEIGRRLRLLMSRYGITPKSTVTASQTKTSLALTRAGVGISLATESTLSQVPADGYTALFLPDEELCTRTLYVARPLNRLASRATLEFSEVLKRVNGGVC